MNSNHLNKASFIVIVEPYLDNRIMINSYIILLNRKEPYFIDQLSKTNKTLIVKMKIIWIGYMLNIRETNRYGLDE